MIYRAHHQLTPPVSLFQHPVLLPITLQGYSGAAQKKKKKRAIDIAFPFVPFRRSIKQKQRFPRFSQISRSSTKSLGRRRREIIPAKLGRRDVRRLSRKEGTPPFFSFLFFEIDESRREEVCYPKPGIHDTFHISELIEWYTRIKYNVNAFLSSRRGAREERGGGFNTFLNIPSTSPPPSFPSQLERSSHSSSSCSSSWNPLPSSPRTTTRVLEGG